MPIITIATTKGGAGKTTIARLLLGHAAQHGRKVAALDADFNHSLKSWAERCSRVPIPVTHSVDETQVVPIISGLQEEHDFIVVDCAGAPTQATLFAIGCADLVLVPLQTTDADVTEAIKTVRLVESASMMIGKPIPVRVVRTDWRPRTSVAAHVQTLIEAARLPILSTRLDSLVAFKDMTFNGLVPVAGPAGTLTGQLFDEVMRLTASTPEASDRLAS